MVGGALSEFIQHLRRKAGVRANVEVLDAQLLERFVATREEAAFETLLERHGPMVLGVCRYLLQDPHDVEDAFQATFLVLVRKAAAIKRRAQLASWLYGVAYRTALRARQGSARRRAHERQVEVMVAAPSCTEPISVEMRPILYEELNRLPEKYRAPLVLCYLQCKTHEEAARQLTWPLGTVKGRLARARELLRKRLTRRGLVLSAGVFTTLLGQSQAHAAVPTTLVSSTMKAVMHITAGHAATAGVVSVQVAALTQGVLHTMFVTKLTIAGTVLLAVSLLGTGAGLLSFHALAATQSPVKTKAAVTPAAQSQDDAKKEADPASEQADRERSKDNLKLLMLAMHEYKDVNMHFPPAALYDINGKALLSWRVLILPYLHSLSPAGKLRTRDAGDAGQDELFKEFKLDEPWDSEHNKKLLAKMPKQFAPVRGKTKQPNMTHYQVFTGKGTGFEGIQGVTTADIQDGTANTIAVVEAAEAVPWTKPADLPYDPSKPLPKLGGMFADVFHAGFFDGAVRTLKRKFDEKTMRHAITRSGGEILDLEKIEADK